MDNPIKVNTQNIINVDIDSRAVTLPVNFNLGVMYDNSCKTITFMVRKKSDITDLTDLTFSVNTISAKGTPDKLECDCREESGFYIITAVLKGTIFEASGKATFNLCGQKFDSSHVEVKAWGSEDITALVGSHFHSEKAIEELYPSVLEELRQKVNNPNLTDEQLDNIATKIAEKGFYTKSEVDDLIEEESNFLTHTFNYELEIKANKTDIPTKLAQLAEDEMHRTVTDTEKEKWNNPTITVDTELDNDSNNPIANSAVTKSINYVITALNSQLEYYATKEDLDTKADKTAIPTQLSQLTDDSTHRLVTDVEKAKWNSLKNVNVITEVTEENADSEDPIAVKAVVQGMQMFESNFESKYISPHSPFNLIGLDKNKLNVITKAWSDVFGYTEFWFVFYGRENNKDDTLVDGDGDDSISVNGVKVIERPLAYIRKNGTYFYTCGHFKHVSEFIFGTVARCDGNGAIQTFTTEPVQATKIDDIIINTSNLFKGDSKFAVYAR